MSAWRSAWPSPIRARRMFSNMFWSCESSSLASSRAPASHSRRIRSTICCNPSRSTRRSSPCSRRGPGWASSPASPAFEASSRNRRSIDRRSSSNSLSISSAGAPVSSARMMASWEARSSRSASARPPSSSRSAVFHSRLRTLVSAGSSFSAPRSRADATASASVTAGPGRKVPCPPQSRPAVPPKRPCPPSAISCAPRQWPAPPGA